MSGRSLLRKLVKLLVGLLAAIGALFVIVTVTPLDNWWTNRLTGPIIIPTGDILIVLGAEAFPDIIGYESFLRAVYAVRVWRAGSFREVLISGGPGPSGVAPALFMRDFLVSQGVPGSAIRVETTSRSTHENAVYSKEILKDMPGRKVLLTSDYHTYRAWRAFRKAGLHVESCSFPDVYKQISNPWARWGVFVGLCGETTKIVYYYVRGWI